MTYVETYVETMAYTRYWQVLNDIVDYRREHTVDPSEVVMATDVWDVIYAGTPYYPKDAKTPEDRKFREPPKEHPQTGRIFGCACRSDVDMEPGSVRVS